MHARSALRHHRVWSWLMALTYFVRIPYLRIGFGVLRLTQIQAIDLNVLIIKCGDHVRRIENESLMNGEMERTRQG